MLPSGAQRRVERACTAVVDITVPFDHFDFSTADRWFVLVLADGIPAARVELPSPGPVESGALAEALLAPHADWISRYESLVDRYRRRLGAPPGPLRASPDPTVSVVVCTHRRPHYIDDVLGGLQRLDPAPAEIIIVDNDPGDLDCRHAVEAAGGRYVREDRRGLDNARNAGLRAARGDVVAFTDDDCVPSPGWLRFVGEAFDDPLVAAASGPAFPYVLDTPARVRMERQASLTRGLRRRMVDWTLLPPAHAGQLGVGANLLVRRTALGERPFPPELDAGTATGSGGDTYLLARLIAEGRRVVYDPRIFVFHQHRPDGPSLHRAVVGYGKGVTATISKLLVEEGELEAPVAGRWLWDQYRETQARRLRGRADAVETRLSWDYLRGGFMGPGAWLRARRHERALDGQAAPSPPCSAPSCPTVPAPAARTDGPSVSVVIPTVRRPEALQRCLTALETQTVLPLEVIVVDDADPPTAAPTAPGREVRLLATHGAGAAAARNAGAREARGEVVLFLDDDLVASPGLVARHAAGHAKQPRRVVVGPSVPRPADSTLAASGAAIWWEDHFRALRAVISPTFTDWLSGNASVRREVFLELGGFDAEFGRHRREDWEWGIRAQSAGVELTFDPLAVCDHNYRLTAVGRLRAARGEGQGDALLLRRHPQAYANLPIRDHHAPSPLHLRRWLTYRLLGLERAEPVLETALGCLERHRLRSAWLRLQNRAQHAAYGAGLRAGGYRRGPTRLAVRRIDVDADAPIPAPGTVTPDVELVLRGRPRAHLRPLEGHWHPRVADQIAAIVGFALWPELASDPPPVRAIERPRSVCVLLRAGDAAQAAALQASGAQVHVLTDDDHWGSAADALHHVTAAIAVVPFPGRRVGPRLLDDLQVAFEAPRVGVAIGDGPEEGWRRPLVLQEGHPGRRPFSRIGAAAGYIALRTAALPAIGGLEPALRPLGEQAQALWCAERALRAGWLVANCDSTGVSPGGRRAASRARSAWVGLLALHAQTMPVPRRAAAGAAGAMLIAGRGLGAARRRDRRFPLRAAAAGRDIARGLLGAGRVRQDVMVQLERGR